MDIEAYEIETFADVHALFARQRLVYKRDVARAMGVSPDRFSTMIRDLGGRPSPEWIASFREAWKAVEREKGAG